MAAEQRVILGILAGKLKTQDFNLNYMSTLASRTSLEAPSCELFALPRFLALTEDELVRVAEWVS